MSPHGKKEVAEDVLGKCHDDETDSQHTEISDLAQPAA
jgi:hypothetical protein